MNTVRGSGFVLVLSILFFLAGCGSAASQRDSSNVSGNRKVTDDYSAPQILGTIKNNEIRESSGIAASRCSDDVFWTHNDSGDKAILYAVNSKGESLGTYKIPNADNDDWEDIASYRAKTGECFLYIGDIGNNDRDRSELTIYVLKEPRIEKEHKSSSRKTPLLTVDAQAVKFRYPDIVRDAETLMVHPENGEIYILSKSLNEPSAVYKLSPDFSGNSVQTLEKIATLAVPAVPNGFLTGGDISPDGKRVIICDYFSAYELVLPDDAKNFDEIWKVSPQVVLLGERNQGEAVAYAADGESIFATSEKKNSPVINVRRK